MAEMSDPVSKFSPSSINALTERAICETGILDRDKKQLKTLLRSPQNVQVWGRAGGNSSSTTDWTKPSTVAEALSETLSKGVSSAVVAGSNAHSCKVQGYFTQSLGDVPRASREGWVRITRPNTRGKCPVSWQIER